MNLLSQYLTIDTVRLDIDVVSRKRLFEEASFAIETAYGEDHDTVFEALMARERLGSTALGHGCAVPHGRLESLQEPALVLLRTKQPIAYDAPDDKPVRLFMTLLVPQDNPEEHLQILREIAALFADDAVRGSGGNLGFTISTFTDLILRVALVFILTIPLGFAGVGWAWAIGWTLGACVALAFYFNIPCLKKLRREKRGSVHEFARAYAANAEGTDSVNVAVSAEGSAVAAQSVQAVPAEDEATENSQKAD